MNETIILNMAHPYVKDSSITYDQFDKIYSMLSLKEKYQVCDILYKNGINLVTDDERNEEGNYILEIEENQEDDFEILYDENIFMDEINDPDVIDNHLLVNQDITQKNSVLCALIQQGNKQAAQDLCVKNKRLVDKYVNAYLKKYGKVLDFDDLEQVGYMGLLKAAQRYDTETGCAFSTYAVYWIKQSITREIINNGYIIRIPVHMVERINKVNYVEKEYSDLNLQERIEKISEKLMMPKDNVEECMILRNNFLAYSSLDSPVGEDGETELIELIPDETISSVEDVVMDNELKESLRKVLDTLKPKERDIVELRFGLGSEQPKTLEEIGKLYNVTRERIRQIENKAINKLRHPVRLKIIRDFR